jgi:4-hydroxymandelate oxidase
MSEPINVSDYSSRPPRGRPDGLGLACRRAGDEVTLRASRAAYGRWFRPRVLVDVGEVSTSTPSGTPVSMPLLVAPPASAHPAGEVATARATAEAGTDVRSTVTTCAHDEIALAAGEARWLQPTC